MPENNITNPPLSAPTEPKKTGLRRAVGTWGSFTWGYADVGADVYVALGLVAGFAQGGTPLAFLITGFVYIFIGLAYTELASTYPVAGGGQFYTLRGLGDLLGFTAGWSLLLDFSIDISLFAVATAGYLNYFLVRLWPPIIEQPWWAIEALILIGILILLNIKGIRESALLNEALCAVDLVNETFILIMGFAFAFSPQLLFHQFVYEFPTYYNFLYGSSIAIISYIGLESISQASEETLRPANVIPRTSLALIFTVILYALAFSTLGLGVMPWQVLAEHASDPVAMLAQQIPFIGSFSGPFTAILAMTLIYSSCNTGIMGCSRIAYSMSKFQLLPSWFEKVHEKFRTPVRTIVVFSSLAILQVILASWSGKVMDILANMYAFGAVTGYILVMVSLIVLRFKDPYSPRPYLMPGNIKLKIKLRTPKKLLEEVRQIAEMKRKTLGEAAKEQERLKTSEEKIVTHKDVKFPISAIIGLLGLLSIWVVVILTHEIGRIAGPAWIVFGLIIYFIHRKTAGLPLLGSVKRDWDKLQMEVLADAQEEEILAKFREAIRKRDVSLRQAAAHQVGESYPKTIIK
jgi:APA family basic amino acid/polyamine antiporter